MSKIVEPRTGFPLLIVGEDDQVTDIEYLMIELYHRNDLISLALQVSSAYLIKNKQIQNIINKYGLELDEEELQYQKDISGIDFDKILLDSSITFRNFEQVGYEPFLEVSQNTSEIKRLNTLAAFKYLQKEDFNAKLWEVAYVGTQLCGMVLGQVYAEKKLGTIQYIAVCDKFKGKKLGKKLFAKALSNLKNCGAEIYRDGTEPTNHPMLGLFEWLDCELISHNMIFVGNGLKS